mmetsp:Transcript_30254/g.47398  ORF Transcript_30254/g.47398 Transcript_30254/m.47398 type:complete len:167 (-) Transcript_30254:1463-1963(-)
MSMHRRHSLGSRSDGQQSSGLRLPGAGTGLSMRKDSTARGQNSTREAETKPPRKLCEKCQRETRGNLKLPCGRVVKLCEPCSMQFYDILMNKIMECETPFAEYVKSRRQALGSDSEPQATQASSPALSPSSTRKCWTLPLKTKSGDSLNQQHQVFGPSPLQVLGRT